MFKNIFEIFMFVLYHKLGDPSGVASEKEKKNQSIMK